MPLPPAYEAFRGGAVPRPSAAGSTPTVTGSVNWTAMPTMRPVPYVPFWLGEETRSTEGGTPSISIFFE